MSVLRQIRDGGQRNQEALPVVRGTGVQKRPRGRDSSRAKKSAENHRLRGLRQAGLIQARRAIESDVALCSRCTQK